MSTRNELTPVRVHLDDDGNYHHDTLPAILWPDGTQQWYIHGTCHRDNGPAYISLYAKKWYFFGKLHRDDGPAVENGPVKQWYKHGKLHREDGPATHNARGIPEWYIDGVKLSEKEFKAWRKQNGKNKQPDLPTPSLVSPLASTLANG